MNTLKNDGVSYVLHHIGIPTQEVRNGERFSAKVGMYTSDDLSGPIPVQWHRYTPSSPLPALIKEQPHLAYKVNDLEASIIGHCVILGPYEPIDDYLVAMIDHGGIPVELIQTTLSDEEIWGRAISGEKTSIYS
ncbi:hypothetical protein [Snodgrassella sp. CFCC 13594]|uniref:hypothetical protein n=1 Tax=Snodgrassella sp. CFCC 13594 TaxID=1775559 RepID=UPI00082A4E5D|nr:hypothetical protein [Snodgrassella sp. CFCC 13594]